MQLVIDATSITERLTGIERYTFAVTEQLVFRAIEAGYLVMLLISKNFLPSKFNTSDSSSLIIKKSPFASRLLTEQLWIPWLLFSINEAVCFFPAFPPSPIINLLKSNKRIIKTVFDAVMWRHPETVSWKNKLYMRPLETFWMNRYDYVHTISAFSLKEIASFFPIARNKMLNSGIGCVGSQFKANYDERASTEVIKRYGLPKEFLFFVGTLEPRKNLLFLLDVILLLMKKMPRIKLVIAGRFGWGAKELFEYVQERHIGANVHFLGSVPDNDLPILYKLASIFVFPSVYEGFGLPVVEAMASGTPVIASNAASIPEATGEAAILLPPDNVNAWVEAIFELFHDADLRNKMVQEGYQQAQKFSWQDVAQKILDSF